MPPTFHLHAAVISKGTSAGGARGFSHYLARAHQDHASQLHRYIDRENGQPKDDLVASGHAHMPAWATENPHAFWLAADQYERKNGVVARVMELSLPRELSADAQRDLADDLRQTFFSQHTHSWALHSPPARDGSGEQPHLHVMFSPRTSDGLDRDYDQYFSRYNAAHPDQGGARKDASWSTKGRLHDLRWGTATLINAALEREGLDLAVTHVSLRAQGLDRDPARYRNPQDATEKATVQTYRNRLHQSGESGFEQARIHAAWERQKRQEGLYDLSRTAMMDHVHAQTFGGDRSPQGSVERPPVTRRQNFGPALAHHTTRYTSGQVKALEQAATLRDHFQGRASAPEKTQEVALSW